MTNTGHRKGGHEACLVLHPFSLPLSFVPTLTRKNKCTQMTNLGHRISGHEACLVLHPFSLPLIFRAHTDKNNIITQMTDTRHGRSRHEACLVLHPFSLLLSFVPTLTRQVGEALQATLKCWRSSCGRLPYLRATL